MTSKELSETKPSFFSSGLGRRLILYLVLISSLVTLLITTVQLYFDYRSDINYIEEQLLLVDKLHIKALSGAIWASDLEEVKIYLEGMSHIRDIQYVLIETQDKKQISVGAEKLGSVIERTYPILYEYRGKMQLIGSMRVAFSLAAVYQRLANKVITILVSNGTKTFIVAILILMVFHRLITRHLHHIAQYSGSMGFHEYSKDLKLERDVKSSANKDELDDLVLAINGMRYRLHDSIEAVKEKTRRYRSLLESSRTIPWELDLDTWVFTYVGPQAVKVLGYPVEDWYKESFLVDHIYYEDKEEAVNLYVTSAELGEDHEFEYRMVAADGRLVWIRDTVNIIVEDGKRTKLQGFKFDITHMRESQSALERSEQKFSSVFQFSPVAVLISSMDEGRVIEVNAAFESLFGYTQDELVGKTTHEFNLWFQAEERLNMLEQIRLQGKYVNEVRELVTSSGAHVQCQLAAHAINIGGENCLITVLMDVSERLRIESTIKSLAQSSTVNNYQEFVGRVVKDLAYAYQSQYAFIGILLPNDKQVETLAVWTGQGFADNFVYDLQGTPCQDILDLKRELIPSDAWKLYPDDVMLKDMKVESYYGAPLISSDNKLIGLIAVMDVHEMEMQPWLEPVLGMFASRIAAEVERQQIHEELEIHRDHLEDLVKERTAEMENLNQELEAFSYSVSHDLRAPLRSISGFSQALMEDYSNVLDEEGMDYLQRVCKGSVRMSDLIDDMLNLSRVSRSEINRNNVDLTSISKEVVKELQLLEPERSVSVSISDNLRVNGDNKLFTIVMTNLIGNAWKYTGYKQKAVIEIGQKMQDGIEVYFVKDNGAGFNMKYAKNLFNAFNRLHDQTDFEGTGIGLATVKRVITRHGGRVWADSQSDVGSVFYFTVNDARDVK